MSKYNSEKFNSGKALERAKTRLELSPDQMAEKLGLSSKTYKEYERRNTDSGIKKIMDYCNKLGCDLDFFVGAQDSPIKEDTEKAVITIDESNIWFLTGLNPEVVKTLMKEKDHPITSVVRGRPGGKVIIGISTADIVNDFVGFKGIKLKNTMVQYAMEKAVLSLLEKSARNIVDNYNHENKRADSFESFVMFISNTLSSMRMVTSLSSLKLTNIMQTGIEDDWTIFCKKMAEKKIGLKDSKVLFDYMQSKNRVEALKMDCYNHLMQFIDELSEDNQLKFHSNFFGEDFELSEVILHEESVEDIEAFKNELMVSSLKRHLEKKNMKLQEERRIKKELVEENSKISADYNDLRQENIRLKEEIDRLKGSGEKK